MTQPAVLAGACPDPAHPRPIRSGPAPVSGGESRLFAVEGCSIHAIDPADGSVRATRVLAQDPAMGDCAGGADPATSVTDVDRDGAYEVAVVAVTGMRRDGPQPTETSEAMILDGATLDVRWTSGPRDFALRWSGLPNPRWGPLGSMAFDLDLNGDGAPELDVMERSEPYGPEHHVYWMSPGYDRAVAAPDPPGSGWNGLGLPTGYSAAVDLDGDTGLEVYALAGCDVTVRDAAGFAESWHYHAHAQGCTAQAVDLDGDCHFELVVTESQPPGLVVLRAGEVIATATSDWGPAQEYGVGVDADGDGLPDLWDADYTPPSRQRFRSGRTFQAIGSVRAIGGLWGRAAWPDHFVAWDLGEGSPFLIAQQESVGEVAIAVPGLAVARPLGPVVQAVDDFDGDGRADLIVDDGHVLRLLRGPSFVEAWTKTDRFVFDTGVWLDVDGDGLTDLPAATARSEPFQLQYLRADDLAPIWTTRFRRLFGLVY